jgi:myo-inositol-1(or 4)-monophosphatase
MTDDPTRLGERLVDIAVEAADAVADGLRTGFRATMDIGFKRDSHDPVTEHDKRAEARIREVILRHLPDSTIVGEEDGRADGSGDVVWHVDPIDGTANFAAGFAFFCVSIGAVVDGEPIAGMILDPMADNLFTAHPGGAFRNGRRLRSAGVTDEARALLLTSYPSIGDMDRDGAVTMDRTAELIRSYSTVRRQGSAALSLAHVAAGWSAAALGTGVKSWDTCAGGLLVRQAGGVYRTFTPGEPTANRWDAPGYLAYTPDLRATALTRLADTLSGAA